MNTQDVITAWDRADPGKLHPTRELVSEAEYWKSGATQAARYWPFFPHGASVLDYGCGDGRVSLPLHNAGYRVTAADTSTQMLARLRHHNPNIRTVVLDGNTPLQGFDVAISLAVLIHQDYATAKMIVRQLRDAVKPGGLLVLDWPTSDEPNERESWIAITTWNVADRNRYALDCGLVPEGSINGHSLWRRV